MENKIVQQSNANPRGRAIVSLVVGIISLINGIGVIYLPIIIQGYDKPFPSIVVKYIYIWE